MLTLLLPGSFETSIHSQNIISLDLKIKDAENNREIQH